MHSARFVFKTSKLYDVYFKCMENVYKDTHSGFLYKIPLL